MLTAVLGADQGTVMRKFLRENRVALMADISVGSGELLEDFAFLIGVGEKQFDKFATTLRFRRKEFRSLMRSGIEGPKGTEQFITWIIGLQT